MILCFGVPIIIPIVTETERYWMKISDYNRQTDPTILQFLPGFLYYDKLSEKAKKRFIKRVRFIAFDKEFIGRSGLEVTDEMRVKVAASLAQLTFGFKDFEIPHFEKIWIYPDIFYHHGHRTQMKGFTAPAGVVALSWPDFQNGYDIPGDNYNLGLHELAHALHINSQHSSDNEYFLKHFNHWSKESYADFEALQNGDNEFFRKYGGNNFYEFFSVCIEHFFESPAAFYEELPYLYIRTCILMAQNPLNDQLNYELKPQDFKELANVDLYRQK
ncbi:MAG: zinc-dependent peptidase [Bacteroidia bacterium]|nr:zinc-dependent peptidase [Bacteroidia bacterium]